MQELELALNEVTEEGIESLGIVLRGMTALQRLNLRENELEDRGAAALAPALAAAIAHAVAALPVFERLLLDENEISVAGEREARVCTSVTLPVTGLQSPPAVPA